tara:strand:+ start:2694 stop:2906 length:213 start_codon:yes stop_codon:yes gene_type:complete
MSQGIDSCDSIFDGKNIVSNGAKSNSKGSIETLILFNFAASKQLFYVGVDNLHCNSNRILGIGPRGISQK